VPRIFITGSTDGLGRAAAGALIGDGHDVVLHARTRERAAALSDLAPDAAGVVTGDLSSAAETRDVAGQVNRIGRMDAVIHNAGVYLEPSRGTTADGHATTLAVNTLAPYLLTALTDRPDRLIYLSSGLHHAGAGAGSLRDIDWTSRPWNAARAYAESKLHLTALALTLARAWPDVLSNAVDPGWVPTRMGGPSATGPADGPSHPDLARRQPRPSRHRERRLLVPPAAAGTRTTSPRPGFPGPAAGPAGRAHRRRALLGARGQAGFWPMVMAGAPAGVGTVRTDVSPVLRSSSHAAASSIGVPP